MTDDGSDKASNLDVIWGTRAIAQAINRTERQTYYLLETGALPGTKIGGTWTTTWTRLRSLFAGKAA